MASWEDIADAPEDIVVNAPDTTIPATNSKKGDQAAHGEATKAAPAKEAPPMPVNRNGGPETTGISQAYLSSQPKMRILQRQSPANAKTASSNPSTTVPAADESAARLHANFEQKQRDYEAARKKLFDEAHPEERTD